MLHCVLFNFSSNRGSGQVTLGKVSLWFRLNHRKLLVFGKWLCQRVSLIQAVGSCEDADKAGLASHGSLQLRVSALGTVGFHGAGEGLWGCPSVTVGLGSARPMCRDRREL